MPLSDFLFSCSGRIPRLPFWLFLISWNVCSLAATVLDLLTHAYDPSAGIGLLSFAFLIATAVPVWAVAVKRAHDRGHPNWYLLLGLVPIIGPLWLFVELGFLKGTNGANKYGPAAAVAVQ